MRLLSAVALAMLLTAAAASAQSSKSFPLTIRVTDPTTAPIPNATVSIAPQSATSSTAPKPLILKTGREGTVTAKLKPGNYTVLVSAFGFSRLRDQLTVTGKTSIAIRLWIAAYHGPTLVNPSYIPYLSPKSTPLRKLIPLTSGHE